MVTGLLLPRRRATRLAALLAASCAVSIVVPIAAMLAVTAQNGGHGSIPETTGLPLAAQPWVPLVNVAGSAYAVNPYLLLAILGVESEYGTNPDTYGLNFLGCCVGPFQFNVVDGPPSSWDLAKEAYQRTPRPDDYIHPTLPHPSPYDSFDATMAAALLIRRKAGGRAILHLDGRAWDAARAYNGSGPIAAAYADEVLARARALVAAAAATPPGWPGDRSTLSWPVAGPVVSGFGIRWGHLHAGIDIAAPAGTPIAAAAAGRIIEIGWVSGYGRFTCIEHAPDLATCYAHQSSFAPSLTRGSVVARGQLIGRVGCTGHCFGDHLHFEVHTSTVIADSTAVDPMRYLEPR